MGFGNESIDDKHSEQSRICRGLMPLSEHPMSWNTCSTLYALTMTHFSVSLALFSVSFILLCSHYLGAVVARVRMNKLNNLAYKHAFEGTFAGLLSGWLCRLLETMFPVRTIPESHRRLSSLSAGHT